MAPRTRSHSPGRGLWLLFSWVRCVTQILHLPERTLPRLDTDRYAVLGEWSFLQLHPDTKRGVPSPTPTSKVLTPATVPTTQSCYRLERAANAPYRHQLQMGCQATTLLPCHLHTQGSPRPSGPVLYQEGHGSGVREGPAPPLQGTPPCHHRDVPTNSEAPWASKAPPWGLASVLPPLLLSSSQGLMCWLQEHQSVPSCSF